MRLIRVAAVLAVAAALSAGCGAAKKTDSAASPGATPGSSVSGAAPGGSASPGGTGDATAGASDNTKAACAATKTAVQGAMAEMRTPLTQMIEAGVKGDEAGRKAAGDKLKKLFLDAATKVEAQAKVATDAKLKTALTDMAGSYRTAGEAFASGKEDALADPKFDAAADVYVGVCGA
ncbi:hypothetical protein Lfu02_53220 [Longispora fulva]|uniref:Uncharacterized protein n=1 Tax=Longispora fulva TaxID=619741 RepID=A0A8J7GM28_9ACTN|nr:hypothetical protein [Longispora fulva]MBG6140786.1 hypothetical protein [Longispora fulva]GIG60950.1 hypothetical protein Lfu02_53220 [Longispora fulva]